MEEERARGRMKRLVAAARPHASLSKVQQLAGLLAALISIGGFVFSYVYATKPFSPTKGDVVALVHEQRSDKPVADATIEVLTMDNAIVTTLTPRDEGRARQTLKEGHYRFRVMHPRFSTEVRQVYVTAGQTAEVRFRMAPRVVPSSAAGNPIDSIRKIFR